MTRHKTLLVTGGTGFVMSHVVRCWLDHFPDGQAVVVDASPPDAAAADFFQTSIHRIEFITGSVADDALWRTMTHRDDVVHVVHGAAVTSINRLVHASGHGRPGLTGARKSIAVNIDGTLNVLEFAAGLPNLSRLVNVSSGSVYSNTGPEPLPEDGYVEPEGIYPITKYSAERFTAFAADDLGLSAVSVRLSGVFGPMDRDTAARGVRSAPRVIAEKALAGEPVRIRSYDGAGDFVAAGDVANAVVALLRTERLRYPVYNVAAGVLTTIGELIDAFRDRVGGLRTEEVETGEVDVDYPPDQRHGRYGAYDISRIRADTGWQPRPLADGVSEYVDWLGA